ncbi:hypothetical protein QTN47_17105 [Danxiaibacter flavus]|uniref:Uncharacterized protein n=1 Tax=Danxiaibacter flavus TaxID=3049108 RepID=A0ABV3ZH62_9BACT|nr:hypothetical protein QNM32_17115 [Chitinophagaceae bacterium DXS]
MFRANNLPEYIEVDGPATGEITFEDFKATVWEYQLASLARTDPGHRVIIKELVVIGDPAQENIFEVGPNSDHSRIILIDCELRNITLITPEPTTPSY